MRRGRLAAAAAGLLAAAPALAVGFGPLVANGVIDGPREGFAFQLMNPYGQAADFVVYAVGWDDDRPEARVALFPAEAALGAGRTRQVLAVADGLAAGETFHFRVCAERRDLTPGTMLHARVCSKVTAHRLG